MCNNYNQNLHSNSIDSALHEFSKKNIVNLNLDDYYETINEIEFQSLHRFQAKLLKPKDIFIHNLIFGNVSANDKILLVKGAPGIKINF